MKVGSSETTRGAPTLVSLFTAFYVKIFISHLWIDASK